MGAFSIRVEGGADFLYAKGSVVQSSFGVFEVWAHEFLRIVCIRYATLRHYHIRWWYWSKKQRYILGLSCGMTLRLDSIQEAVSCSSGYKHVL